MKVLLVGSGAREHALAIAIAASAECERLVISPGNAGMADVGEIANIGLQDIEGLCSLAQNIPADLVVIGPEAPLAAGLVDRLTEYGIACFGPSAGAAQIESSKAFAKAFMMRHGILPRKAKVSQIQRKQKPGLRILVDLWWSRLLVWPLARV